MGPTVGLLRNLVRDDLPVLDLLDQALQGDERPGERRDLVDNVNEVADRPTGNARDQALRRLRKDRPDLRLKLPHLLLADAGLFLSRLDRKRTPICVLFPATGAVVHRDRAFPPRDEGRLIVELLGDGLREERPVRLSAGDERR